MEPFLNAIGIIKHFPGVLALDQVDFECIPGEVHALAGENGAGKSTLMKILAGVYTPDGGELVIKGKQVTEFSPRRAQELGIGIIYQELSLLPYLTVAENIHLGREFRTPIGMVDFKRMEQHAVNLLDQFDCHIPPRTLVYHLSPAQRQLVEIAKSLSYNPDIIIMDEPTSSLVDYEIENLFQVIRSLRERGVTIIYITHRLEEIFKIADRVTVLKDGHKVITLPIQETNRQGLIRNMVGRDVDETRNLGSRHIGDAILEVRQLSREGVLHDISFEARRGEILGIAGLVGSGRTELARAIFAADPINSGQVLLNGATLANHSPRQVIDKGVALIPEDRKSDGLILIHTLRENIALPSLNLRQRLGFIDSNAENQMLQLSIQELAINAPDVNHEVANLSGGNQQKAVLAKWLNSGADVIIFDEPTRGIDVAAKSEIHNLICKLVQAGKAIIMISSELPEILTLSDRVLVLSNGILSGELSRAEATEEKILELAYQNVDCATPTSIDQHTQGQEKSWWSKVRSWLANMEPGINVVFALLFLLIILGSLGSPRFLTPVNLTNMLRQAGIPLLLGLGQTLVIISGGIDFSVAGIITITNVLAAGVAMGRNELTLPVVAMCLGIGLSVGALNAFLIIRLRVPPIIATLGTTTMLHGAALIYTREPIGMVPRSLSYFSQGWLGPLPVSTYLIVIILVLGAALLYKTAFGRHLYAVGGDEEIAKLSGISVFKVRSAAYLISGFLAALTGLYLVGRMGSGEPTIGPGMEFDSIAAVLLGGAVLGGGRGSLGGTIAGALVLVLLSNVFNQIGIQYYFQEIAKGFIIILAVAVFRPKV